jgi:RNA recognition motif-containing protein
MQLFGKYGGIRAAKIVHITKDNPNYQFIKGKSHCYAFICFVTPDSAKKAKKNLNGKIFIKNGPRLYVDYHQTKKERVEFLKLQMMKKVQNNPYKYYIKPLLQINQANPAFTLDKFAPITNPPFPLPLPMPLQMIQNRQNPQMANVPQPGPIALVDVQNPQHAKAYMQISENIIRANENFLNAQKAANAQNVPNVQNIPYDPNAQYAQNVPKVQMNLANNEQYRDTIALSNKIFSKLLDDTRYVQYQHLFPKIVKIFLKNFNKEIDSILSDDQAFTHNMSIVIPQAQREAEMEMKFRDEQRRIKGQESQGNIQPQGMNLYNLGYQQFLQGDRDKDGEKDKEESEEFDQKIDENLERLMVGIDYFKHQKNKDSSNDDKSK